MGNSSEKKKRRKISNEDHHNMGFTSLEDLQVKMESLFISKIHKSTDESTFCVGSAHFCSYGMDRKLSFQMFPCLMCTQSGS